jgi:hypothetical protein
LRSLIDVHLHLHLHKAEFTCCSAWENTAAFTSRAEEGASGTSCAHLELGHLQLHPLIQAIVVALDCRTQPVEACKEKDGVEGDGWGGGGRGEWQLGAQKRLRGPTKTQLTGSWRSRPSPWARQCFSANAQKSHIPGDSPSQIRSSMRPPKDAGRATQGTTLCRHMVRASSPISAEMSASVTLEGTSCLLASLLTAWGPACVCGMCVRSRVMRGDARGGGACAVEG